MRACKRSQNFRGRMGSASCDVLTPRNMVLPPVLTPISVILGQTVRIRHGNTWKGAALKGCVSKGQPRPAIRRGGAPAYPSQKFVGSLQTPIRMIHSNRKLHDDPIRREDFFYTVDHAAGSGQNFCDTNADAVCGTSC